MPTNIQEVITRASAWMRHERETARLRETIAAAGCHIYGAGGFGRQVAAALEREGWPLHGFIDTFVGGGEVVASVPCRRPEEVDAASVSGSVLIVAVNNFKVPTAPIAEWARGMGFADIVFVPELPDVLGPDLGTYWQASRALMADHADDLVRLDALLADDVSRAVLAGLARYRITGLPEDHPEVDRDHQYFPCDLPLGKAAINLVDCGAFPGDMVQATADAGLALEQWYAFEPDPQNFKVLGEVARAANLPSAALFPCGVGGETGLVGFATGAADASRALAAGDAGGTIVPVVRVDDVVQAQRIDMVKLDIEGFEAQAIDGMAELLRRHRPRLAVAIYHKPADLWELPFKIAGLFPQARFAIRQHGHNGYDTVLYADL